ncbi:Hypothetical protein P9211_01151 [Prochlorococcus marinus str. MIT 9211]|uniref:Uncharacterized protein n=1 Tax=Prochlorococcus marinus (strain MIT 9211) TaxID=93059 RepID=A9BCV8_PROM4|nr:Hypothetical protein P9211_01151 [Prochlorococcus marinus str. MIT 9211]
MVILATLEPCSLRRRLLRRDELIFIRKTFQFLQLSAQEAFILIKRILFCLELS